MKRSKLLFKKCLSLIVFLSLIFSVFSLRNLSAQTDFWTTTASHPINIGERFGADSIGNLYCIDSSVYKKFIHKSTNSGLSWNVVYILPDAYLNQSLNGLSVLPDGRVFVGTDTSGFLYTTNGGANWKLTGRQGGLQTGFKFYNVTKASNGNLIATSSSQLYRSTDNGTSWAISSNGIVVQEGGVIYLTQSGALLYGNGASLFRSSDNGLNWITVSVAYANYCRIRGGSGNSFIMHAFPGNGSNIFYTTDAGNTWQTSDLAASAVIPTLSYSFNGNIHYIYINDTLFKSSNGGASFQKFSSGIIFPDHIKGDRSGNMFVYFEDDSPGMYRSTNQGALWDYIENGVTIGSRVYKILFDNSGRVYSFKFQDERKVNISTNSGSVWRAAYTQESFFGPCTDSNSVYAAADFNSANSYVVKTTDGGYSWNQIGANLPFFGDQVNDMIVFNNFIFTATNNFGLYRSTSNGSNWVNLNNGISSSANAQRILRTASGTILLALGVTNSTSGIFTSTNNGDSWQNKASLNTGEVNGFYKNQNNLYCFTNGDGIYKSTTDGSNWNKITTDVPAGVNIKSMVINSLGNIFIAATPATINGNFYGGVYRSVNAGSNFVQINSGIADAFVNSLVIDPAGYLLGGTQYFGVIRSKFSTTVDIRVISSVVPDKFELKQNYPNPFNPETKINFSIPIRSFVSLKVFDITGRVVSELVNSFEEAGTYSYSFNGGGLSSGIYFYKLTAGNISFTKKMMLIK